LGFEKPDFGLKEVQRFWVPGFWVPGFKVQRFWDQGSGFKVLGSRSKAKG